MKTKISIVILGIVLAITLVACEWWHYGTIIEDGIDIRLTDINGNNLLDSTNPNAFDVDSIQIYRLLPDGNLWLAQNEGTHCPNGFEVYKGEYAKMYIEVSSDGPDHPELSMTKIDNSTTYIRWNSQDTDTVYATIYHKKGLHCIDEVYYNGKLMIEGYLKRGSSALVKIHVIKNK